MNINRNQRLQPRKPDYLRDSFDLSELIGPVASGGKQALDASTDESQPRHVPPEPAAQTRLQKHPLHRSIAENSLEFGASSEDDVPAKREQVCLRKMARQLVYVFVVRLTKQKPVE